MIYNAKFQVNCSTSTKFKCVIMRVCKKRSSVSHDRKYVITKDVD